MKATSGNSLGSNIDGTEISIPSEAQGDILIRGASNWERLGAGTSGQFLKTQGAASNPLWAANTSSMQYVGTTTLGGSATTLDSPTLDLNSDKMYIIHGAFENSAAGSSYTIKLNSDTTAGNYNSQRLRFETTSVDTVNQSNAFYSSGSTGYYMPFRIEMWRDSVGDVHLWAWVYYATSTSVSSCAQFHYHWNSTANVTSFSLVNAQASGIAAGSFMTVHKVVNS